MAEPLRLPAEQETRDRLREHYETHTIYPPRDPDAPLPEVDDHPDEDWDETL